MSEGSGFLNDLGLDQVEADPNYIPDGKYPGFVFESKVEVSKNGNKQWVLTYKFVDGRTQKEWKNLEPKGPNRALQLSFLKQRVLSLGIPETRVGTFQPSEVIGVPVWIQIKHRDGYQNVGTVELRTDDGNGPVQMPSAGISTSAVQNPSQAGLL